MCSRGIEGGGAGGEGGVGGWKEKKPAKTLSPSYNSQFSHCKLYLEIFLGEGLSFIFSISKLFSSS
jgi:hypothetical protein